MLSSHLCSQTLEQTGTSCASLSISGLASTPKLNTSCLGFDPALGRLGRLSRSFWRIVIWHIVCSCVFHGCIYDSRNFSERNTIFNNTPKIILSSFQPRLLRLPPIKPAQQRTTPRCYKIIEVFCRLPRVPADRVGSLSGLCSLSKLVKSKELKVGRQGTGILQCSRGAGLEALGLPMPTRW